MSDSNKTQEDPLAGHLTELECSMLADNAIEGSNEIALRGHVSHCDLCQAKVTAFTHERALIRESLEFDDSLLVTQIVVPKFSHPFGLREFAIANVLTGLMVWISQFLWKTIFGELVITVLSWFAIPVPDAYELLVNAALYYTQEGTRMIDVYLGFIVLLIITAGIGWIAFHYRGTRTSLSLCLVAAVAASSMVSAPAQALTYLKGDTITLAADETIDDTLIIAGDTIVLDGTVNGDVLALGRRVIVNGPINGNLVSFAQDVEVNANVQGLIVIAAQSAEFKNATIGGDVWTATENVRTGEDVSIAGNLITATSDAFIAGQIGWDYYVFGDNIDITGTIGQDLEAFADQVNLLSNAMIKGDLRFRTENEDHLRQTPNATVNGVIEFLDLPEEFDPRNRYTDAGFYLNQVVRLLCAFLTGVVVLWMIPALRDVRMSGGLQGLKTAGIGLVALVSVPLILAIVAVTVIGIPVTVIGTFGYIAVIYLAKIVLASKLGQVMLSATDFEDNLLLTLLTGLVVIILAINLPAIGGVINFLLTIVGIGLITQMMLRYLSDVGDKSYD
ncbi:MAG: hypothetical protein ACI8Z1_001431 [Candidatus Azotimanducaceae bacterium]|jgi:hypothetical protein